MPLIQLPPKMNCGWQQNCVGVQHCENAAIILLKNFPQIYLTVMGFEVSLICDHVVCTYRTFVGGF